MVRFINRNPFFTEAVDGNDAEAQEADFVPQFTNSKENIDDPTYWCSRPHNWEGINKETNHFNRAHLDSYNKDTQTYDDLVANVDNHASVANYWIGSQQAFIVEKNDGLGLDYLPTVFWVEQSASVAFRRRLDNTEIPGSLKF